MVKRYSFYKCSLSFIIPLVFFSLFAIFSIHTEAFAKEVKQKTFASPEEAVNAFIGALKVDNEEEILAIMGKEIEEIIYSGDKVADKKNREKFLKSYEEKHSIEQKAPDNMVLSLGNDDWPFPIPVVKKGKTWQFDTKAGKEEMLNRRIGRNELSVIEVLQAYVDAQHEYASKDYDGNGDADFAQKLWSSEGKKDGLYWEAKDAEEISPMGPLVAEAASEGYKRSATGEPAPYHGYYLKMLKAQGKNALGGKYNYVVNGKMILGFAALAYPAKYGNSGIMTFMVNQQGIVYQKDIGKNSEKAAKAINIYDPDKTWKKVE